MQGKLHIEGPRTVDQSDGIYNTYSLVARDLWQHKPLLSSGYALGLGSVYCHKSLATRLYLFILIQWTLRITVWCIALCPLYMASIIIAFQYHHYSVTVLLQYQYMHAHDILQPLPSFVLASKIQALNFNFRRKYKFTAHAVVQTPLSMTWQPLAEHMGNYSIYCGVQLGFKGPEYVS